MAKIGKPRVKVITKLTHKHLKTAKEAWVDIYNRHFESYLISKKIPVEISEEGLLKAKCDHFLLNKDALVKNLIAASA